MAVSSTFTNDYQVHEIFTEVLERCEIFGPAIQDIHLNSARTSLNLLFAEWQNRGLNLWAMDQQTQALSVSTASYSAPSGTVAIIQAVIRDTTDSNRETYITPVSRSEYLGFPTKTQTAKRPSVFYFERAMAPLIFLWPIVDAVGQTLVYYRLRALSDITTTLTQTAEVPQRWLEAMHAGCAAKMAVKWAPHRLIDLVPAADKSFELAASEDRERVPLRIAPDYSWDPL